MKDLDLTTLAEEWADKHFLDDVDMLMDRPWPEAKERYNDILVNFGRIVLSNQWNRPCEQLPAIRQRIIICYQSYYEGRYLTLYMTDRYSEEGFNGGAIKTESVIAWMPLPEL